MQKFTIFTIIFAAIVVVIATEMVLKESQIVPTGETPGGQFALPDSLDLAKSLGTSVVHSDEQVTYQELPVESASGGVSDFENQGLASFSVASTALREEQIKSAGFTGAFLAKEASDGLLFKSLRVDDLAGAQMEKFVIKSESSLFAKVYVLSFGASAGIDEVYNVLKARAAEGLESEINVTNDFGRGSFYLNDSRRQETAFLIVKFDALIYAFSYPKEFHPQLKNLIKLLELEQLG